jgi:predicted RNA binding protein YcfA (HicA-like mRNA interferase family)
MPSFHKRKIESALLQKGFVAEEGGNHTNYKFEPDRVQHTIATSISQGSDEELGAGLVSIMAEQINLKSQEFARLIECPMDRDEYVRILQNRNILEGSPDPPTPSVVNFSDAQVSRVQTVLEGRIASDEYNFDHRRSVLYGSIENGKLSVEEVEALQNRGILREADVAAPL